LGGIFKNLRSKGKLPPRVRAMDMRHILIILPFLLEGLLTDEIEEHNAANQFIHRVVDPSSKMVDITIMLLSWYHLYRRKIPAKDEEDIKNLSKLGDRYLNAYCAYSAYICIYFIMNFNHVSLWRQVPSAMQGAVSLHKQIWKLHRGNRKDAFYQTCT
jgi:hypothetical protein